MTVGIHMCRLYYRYRIPPIACVIILRCRCCSNFRNPAIFLGRLTGAGAPLIHATFPTYKFLHKRVIKGTFRQTFICIMR